VEPPSSYTYSTFHGRQQRDYKRTALFSKEQVDESQVLAWMKSSKKKTSEFKYQRALQYSQYVNVKMKLQEMVGFTLKPQCSMKLLQKRNMHEHSLHSPNKNEEGNVRHAKGYSCIRKMIPAEALRASEGYLLRFTTHW